MNLLEMGIPAGVAGIDFIQSRAMQGDPTSRAMINAAGGITGLAASAALASRMGGNKGLAGALGYMAGGYISDRLMGDQQPEPEPQVVVQQQPPFDQETMLRAQLANMQRAEAQSKRQQQEQAMAYLNQMAM